MPIDYHGLLVLDKPTGITSRDAVNRVQTWFPRGTRIGHTGTLDPLATGVLVLCVGSATRLTEYVQRMSKVYAARITLGAVSDTDDADGAITPTQNAEAPSREQVEHRLAEFLGTIEQVPPAYSAAKVSGRRAYALARKGEEISLTSRPVTVHAIEIKEYAYPTLDLVVQCGKGTYIRSIARDLGDRLECGGYISALRRTAVGTFTEVEALSLDTQGSAALERLLPIARAVSDLPSITLEESLLARLQQGQRLALQDDFPKAGEVAIFDHEGSLRVLASIEAECMQPTKVMVQ